MEKTQQRQKHPHLLLNIVLIVLETFYSFILAHDSALKLQAKNFIAKKTTIQINSYIPFFNVYLQFTDKGLLFDFHSYDRHIDIEINTTLIDLIKIFFLSTRRSIPHLRIVADPQLADELLEIIPHFSLKSIFSNWKQLFENIKDDAETIVSERRIAPLFDKIDRQRSEINDLQVELKQYQHRLQHLKLRQRNINIGFTLIITILLILLTYSFVWN